MKKTKKKVSKSKTYHILAYVEDSSPRLKRFDTKEELGKFIDDFNKAHPGQESYDNGYWTDYAITDITGDVHFFTDGLALE